MLSAMKKEISLRKDYLRSTYTQTEVEDPNRGDNKIPLETLYFGGGTPSLLSIDEIEALFDTVKQYYILLPNAEITIEVNPDDLTNEYLKGLLQLGFNRLSVGVQSLYDDDLQWMNRRHNVRQALLSIENARKLGFQNINVDLLYGFPSMTTERWKKSLKQLVALDAPHLSAYYIIIEPRTIFYNRQKKGEVFDISEEDSAAHFETLIDITEKAGYEHYEISNFARQGFRSRHNTAYWQQQPYIGIGPSAHSYNGQSRQWNASNNNEYIVALEKESVWFESEKLTVTEQYNEYIMLSIRAAWGVDSDYIRTHFGDVFANDFLKQADKYIQNGYVQQQSGLFTLTRKGKMIADCIASDLFCTSN